jgi:hypothetical protein
MTIRGSRATASELASGTPASGTPASSGGGLSQQEAMDLIGSADKWRRILNLTGANQSSVSNLLRVDANTFYISVHQTGDVYKSTDGGVTWSNTANIPNLVSISALKRRSDDGHIFVAGWSTSGQVWKTTDGGGSWTSLGVPNGWIADLFFDGSTNVCVTIRVSGTWTVRRFNGSAWSIVSTPSFPHFGKTVIAPSGRIYSTGSYSDGGASKPAVMWTDNVGANWSYGPISGVSATRSESLAIGPDGELYAGLNSANVLKSVDSGASWSLLTDLPSSVLSVRALMVDHRGYIYAGVDSSLGLKGIYRSVDGGGAWQATGDMLEIKAVNDILLDDDGALWAGGEARSPVTGARLYKCIL